MHSSTLGKVAINAVTHIKLKARLTSDFCRQTTAHISDGVSTVYTPKPTCATELSSRKTKQPSDDSDYVTMQKKKKEKCDATTSEWFCCIGVYLISLRHMNILYTFSPQAPSSTCSDGIQQTLRAALPH